MALKYIHGDGSEIQEFDIILKTEILLELIAGVKADLWQYMEKNMIDKEKVPQDPLSVINWDLEKMRRQLYKTETMEELMPVQHKIIYIRDLIKQIEKKD